MKSQKQYEEFIEKTLEQWREKIDDLQIKDQDEKGHIGRLQDLDALKEVSSEARKKYDELKASQENWQTVSQDLDKVLSDLKAAFERAESAIK